ncbi:hypothetical protein UFOVP1071_54 [uncultured Caudovirales phage]|uniref:Uncharacterized protein n=1 Tax=uncultured Caudovirales phage TaxID=2100421 RepID=A0A6J5QAE0_9CAUD|nr:hypothetical protein UFOVP1071_54 [uncultured Caudovirales phage]
MSTTFVEKNQKLCGFLVHFCGHGLHGGQVFGLDLGRTHDLLGRLGLGGGAQGLRDQTGKSSLGTWSLRGLGSLTGGLGSGLLDQLDDLHEVGHDLSGAGAAGQRDHEYGPALGLLDGLVVVGHRGAEGFNVAAARTDVEGAGAQVDLDLTGALGFGLHDEDLVGLGHWGVAGCCDGRGEISERESELHGSFPCFNPISRLYQKCGIMSTVDFTGLEGCDTVEDAGIEIFLSHAALEHHASHLSEALSLIDTHDLVMVNSLVDHFDHVYVLESVSH